MDGNRIDAIARLCEMVHVWNDHTGEAAIDLWALGVVRKTLWKWVRGPRTYKRLLELEQALAAHPGAHWKDIGRGHIRLYSTQDGSTVCIL